MIRDIQALNSQLDFGALSALSVEELKQLRETGAPDMPIGTSAAAAAAMKYAGVSSSAVTYDVDPELDEYPAHYEVELYTASGEFDYDVDAWTGEILKGPANVSSITGTTTPSGTTGGISADKAKSIALADAGVSESNALGLRVKQDWDDGMTIYEVEFRYNGAEYEYDIRSADGAILKSERDDDNDYYYTTAPSASGSLVGEAAAQSAALTHAGVKESDTSYLSCHLEYDDGRVECYEVEFQAGSTQYEYEIGPYDGAIWKAERETRAAVHRLRHHNRNTLPAPTPAALLPAVLLSSVRRPPSPRPWPTPESVPPTSTNSSASWTGTTGSPSTRWNSNPVAWSTNTRSTPIPVRC